MMANRLYRWMGFVLMVAMAALSSCTSVAPPLATPTTRPTFTPRPTFTITPPATATPTVTPTVTQTAPPAPTPTIPPVSAGTALPVQREPVYEGNLENLRELARWGNGRVDGMAWSGDGSMIAVSTPLGLYLYQAATLERSMFYQTSAPASHPTFSPDSSQVAAAVALTGQLGVSTVLLWSTEGSSLLLSLPVPGRVLALAFSPGGASLSAISHLDRQDQRGATLTQWELPSGRITSEINLSSGETAEAAAFSASGRFAVTRGPNGPIRLWQLSDGVNFATTQESGRNAGPMAFSPDEKALAVGYIDNVRDYLNQNEIRVWHVPSPEDKRPSYLLYTLFDNVRARGPALAEGMEQVLLSLTWSQDSSKIAAGYEDRTVRVWEAAPSQPFRRLAAATFPFALSFSPDGEQLASGGLEIFDVRNAVLLARTNDFLPGLYDMALSPSGNYLALAGYGLIEVRRVEDGSVAYTITGMEGPVNAVDISADGSLMVAACQDGTTRLYRLSDGRYLASLGAPTYPVLTAAFSANGRWIASGNENMRVQVFRVDDGQVMLDLEEPYVSYRLLFSPNVDQLASLTTAGVWLRSFGGEIQRIQANLMGMTGGVSLSDMSYSPGSEFLALAGNGVVRVILPTTGATEYMISTQSSSLPPGVLPWSVAFSPDNAFLATGWSDGSLRLYWAADGTLMASRSVHPEAILRVTFTRDSRLMVTLGAEGVIRLWGVAGP